MCDTPPPLEVARLLAGTLSPCELRELYCYNPWVVPYHRLLCRSTDTFCTLIGTPTPCSAFFAHVAVVSGNTVMFLPLVLRQGTRTLFSFQGTERSLAQV